MKEPIFIILAVLITLVVGVYWVLPAIGLFVLIIFYQLFQSHQLKLQFSSIDYPVSDYRVADTVMLINSSGIILDCNNQVMPMFGYSKNEVIGQPIEFLMDASMQKRHVNLRDMFFITSGQRRMQNRVWALHKDRHRVHVEVHLEISTQNQRDNVICSIRDIERFWQREQDLLAKNRILENTQQGNIGIAHTTLSGHFVVTNAYLTKLLGYSQEEFKNLSLQELIHEADLSAFLKIQTQLLDESLSDATIKLRMKNSKGQFNWLSIQCSAHSTDQSSGHLVLIIADLSRYMALEYKIAQVELEIDAIIGCLPDDAAIWISNPGMSYISRINKQFETLWGLNLNGLESEPQAFLKIVHPDDRKKVSQIYDGHLRGGWNLDYRILLASGQTKKITEQGTLINATSNHPGFLICIQKELEADH